jgi:ABC-2 type transport system permease protein
MENVAVGPLGRRSVGSELRALLAIARKEWIIFRRYPSWVMVFLIWPVLYPCGYIFSAKALGGPHGSGLAAFHRLVGTSDYLGFIVVGSTMYMWLNLTLWDVGLHLRNEQMRGTLESNWLCPVWRIAIPLGGSIAKLGTSLLFLALTVLEFQFIFGIPLLRGDLGLALLVMLLLIPSIYGLGVAFASLVIRFKEAHTLVYLVRGIFMIFCGMTYPLQVMPDWMQRAAAFLPLTYAIRDVRAAVLSDAGVAAVGADLLRLLLFAVALPVLGYLAFRATERRARRTGARAQF